MHNLLIKRQQGFTLVELLVAIAIIAILAIIGLTVFTGLQRGARDATRRSDVQAISKAMEANYNTTGGSYVALETSQFAGGVIPVDPLNGTANCSTNACGYCIAWRLSGALPNPNNGTGLLVTSTAGNAHDICGVAATRDGAAAVVLGVPAPVNVTGYLVCANLETGGATAPAGVYCQGSQR